MKVTNIYRLSLIFALLILAMAFAVTGCDNSSSDDDDDDSSTDDDTSDDDVIDDDTDDDDDDGKYPKACDEIYLQDNLPVFEVEITEENWEAIQYEFENWEELGDQYIELKQYYPLTSFKYEDIEINDAMIRLKGSPWGGWDSGKMQFQISFNENDSDGRFRGHRKLNLDAPDNDPSLLHERLAFSMFREMGLPASCANHAVLKVNGEVYGLYANLEKVDKELIQRYFGKVDDEGELHKWSNIMEGDLPEDPTEMDDLEILMDAESFEEIDALVDLDEAVLEWAGEAVMPHVDGYFVGGWNYYLYDHPTRGWLWIPYDIDYAFEIGGYDEDLITFEVGWGDGKPEQFLTVLSNEYWYNKYMEYIEDYLKVYDPVKLQEKIDTWSDQIYDLMESDPHRPYTFQEHLDAVAELRQFVEDRAAFIREWLDCKSFGGDVDIETYDGKDYYFWHTTCNRENALAYCDSVGGTLAVPQDEDEQEFLTTTAYALVDDNWWIGANDIDAEGVWVDADGNALSYLPWASGQPNGDETQNCVVLDYNLNGGWNDKYCTEAGPAVCVVETK